MSLYKRLHDIQAAPAPGATRQDKNEEIRTRLQRELIEELGPLLYENKLTETEVRKRVSEAVQGALVRDRIPMTAPDREAMIKAISDDIAGYGPIQDFLVEPGISDIMVNGPKSVYVERGGVLTKTDVTFNDQTHLRRVIDKMVSEVGRRIDDSTPICDARLTDGSRINAVIHPVAVGGPYLTIRRFNEERLGIDDLIRSQTLTATAARFLQACIVGRLNIVVCGGSGTGKTTTLNVLSSLIPSDERIVTVEDAKELQLSQEHVLSMESRPPNVDGKGEISIRDLVKNTLRMRPDRIIVGECRSGEALDMLQAMNTGHDGSLTTVHANAPRDALSRIETLVLMAGFDLPVKAIRDQMAAALDLIVHMSRMRDGSRRITHITEVQNMEGDVIALQDIFLYDHSMGVDQHGHSKGRLKATGVRPKFLEKLVDLGIKLPAEIFDDEGFGQAALPTGSDGAKPKTAERERPAVNAAKPSSGGTATSKPSSGGPPTSNKPSSVAGTGRPSSAAGGGKPSSAPATGRPSSASGGGKPSSAPASGRPSSASGGGKPSSAPRASADGATPGGARPTKPTS